MAHYSEWTVEPREQGWLGRLIAPPGGGRPATSAFLLGLAAVAAFIGSLTMDWQSVTVPIGDARSAENRTEQHFTGGIATTETLGLVYTLGAVALFGIVGAAVTRPDLALRLRMAAAGVSAGLLGVLVSVTVRQSDAPLMFNGFSAEDTEPFTLSYEPGIFLGYAAVVLVLAAIWLAGRTAARAAAEPPVEAGAAARGEIPTARRPAPGVVGQGLTVYPSEPLDLTVTSAETPLR